MHTSYQKKLAARVLKCSPSRVKVSQSKDVEEALTRNDIRHLVVKRLIIKKPKRGSSRVAANFLAAQKKKGRRKGRGTKSGSFHARAPKKKAWMKTIRALRKMLAEMRETGRIDQAAYVSMYRRCKGGEFRNKKHLYFFMKDNGMLKVVKRKVVKDG